MDSDLLVVNKQLFLYSISTEKKLLLEKPRQRAEKDLLASVHHSFLRTIFANQLCVWRISQSFFVGQFSYGEQFSVRNVRAKSVEYEYAYSRSLGRCEGPIKSCLPGGRGGQVPKRPPDTRKATL